MRRLMTIAVAALVPSLAFAAGVHITSHQERHLRVRGDATHYALVRAGVPLTFELRGPAKVQLVVRQAFHPGMRPGRTVTRVIVSQDGSRLQTFYVRQPEGGHWARAPIRGRPSAPRTLELDVPPGTHRYRLEVGPRHRELAVAPRLAPAASPLALVPLVPLHHGKADHPAAPAGHGASGGIPLVSLVPPRPRKARHAEHASNTLPNPDAVPLVGLTPPKQTHASGHGTPAEASGEGHPAATGGQGQTGAVALDTGHDTRVTRVTARADEGPTAPPVALPPEATPRPRPTGKVVLALRGLVASHGVGGGTLGGGVGVRLRPGLLDGKVAFGVSVDLVPYALRVDYLTAGGTALSAQGTVQALPILAVAAYTQRLGDGPLSLEATVGAGVVYASATLAGRSGSALAPGGEASVGVLLDAGPGALSLCLRGAGGWGSVAPTSGTDRTALIAGPLGELGVAVGYELSL